jgi:hypothetical protein
MYTPEELDKLKGLDKLKENLPNLIYNAINNLLYENWNGESASFSEKDIFDVVSALSGFKVSHIGSDAIEKELMNFENHYDVAKFKPTSHHQYYTFHRKEPVGEKVSFSSPPPIECKREVFTKDILIIMGAAIGMCLSFYLVGRFQ